MAALDFPLNPTTTSEVTTGDITWKWNGYAWYATTDGSQVIHVGATPPDPALEGQMWWADTDVNEGGGRLYIYTGDEWVDTSLPGGGGGDILTVEQADDLYLSKVDADTAAGQITFQDGISVTGGESATIGTGIVKTGDNLDIVNTSTLCFQAYKNGGALFGRTTEDIGSLNLSYSGGDVSHTVGNIYGLQQQITFNAGANATDAFSFYAVGLNNGGATANYTGFGVASAPSATKNFGFRSDINTEGGKENWGFYALGNAPNFFAGDVTCGNKLTANSGVIQQGIDYLQGGQFSFAWTEINAKNYAKYNIDGAQQRFIVDSGTGNAITLNWQSPNILADVDNVVSVVIGTSSDYRIKENVAPLPSAVETVKALNPVNYNLKSTTFNSLEVEGSDQKETGFIAHEVDALIPGAALGEKDDPNRLQSINTYPIVAVLTKALQEVIAKNEDLEARLAALEGA